MVSGIKIKSLYNLHWIRQSTVKWKNQNLLDVQVFQRIHFKVQFVNSKVFFNGFFCPKEITITLKQMIYRSGDIILIQLTVNQRNDIFQSISFEFLFSMKRN